MSEPSPPRPLTDLAQAERFQLLIDAVKDYAIYLLDADGHVATWNTGAQLFKGYTAQEIIGQHFSVFYTPEDLAVEMPRRALETAAREGRFEAEGWRVRKDGTRFWTHVVIDPVYAENGAVMGFAKITRDVSERRATDQALLESERRFRLLVQGVHDYAIYMLDPEGIVTNWNAGAESIKGYKAGEIVGRHFSLFYTPEDRAGGGPARALETALREGRFEGEGERVRKTGERFWASVVIDPIHDDHGTLLGFAKVTRDITEKRDSAREIARAREELLQAQKMEAIGRLTGGVAHDFNNLLTVIRASADFLRRPNLSEEKRARYVNAIAETADRAAVLTGQLLAFARRQPLQPEVFDVGDRLRGLQQIIGTTIGSSVSVQVRLPEIAHRIQADPSQFETAILNMVINARDAMPRGGAITISASHAINVPSVRGHAAAAGDFVAIDIADTGTGMAPDTLARIFEPFFTTKAVDKGTGLGLSQVYGFAKQSRGEVDVRSRLGQGTTFTLYLPRTLAKAGPPPRAPSVDPGSVPVRQILLVEDNQGVGHFAEDLLRELGQTVTWVGDGQAALDLLEHRAAEFDLVFSDVVMPGISGIELGQEIQMRWPALEVILTSGYSHVIAEEGTHGFPLLKKPYSIDGLLEVLRRNASQTAD
ncbi:MAG: PAS domain S-box protein [Alphaproteobacteria bacterium]|nr:PAS domain S-box protein [Alphaproteobacteria bacterium]MBU1516201.1 PAS domain S-box protein [Alphaproteobacteria bacterium]MBU2093511.1 PAS domain S-box protein [Alphaproteobacteria bacterium]MBU2153551.1 PAS domain S-box protein [Alphaproteobacteria bacterium]MBU2308173.1 PAS domain S-box protein [Alphaproteobacteria bacterium]